MSIDPNGTSFWSSEQNGAGELAQCDIETGELLQWTFIGGSEGLSVEGGIRVSNGHDLLEPKGSVEFVPFERPTVDTGDITEMTASKTYPPFGEVTEVLSEFGESNLGINIDDRVTWSTPILPFAPGLEDMATDFDVTINPG